LVIVDITDKKTPKFVGSYYTGNANGVVVEGNYAYVADYDNGLVIVDITDKANPKFVGSYDTGSARDVVVERNYAYVADYLNGLVILRVDDPNNPANIRSYPNTGSLLDIYFDSSNKIIYGSTGANNIYGSTGANNINVDVSDPENAKIKFVLPIGVFGDIVLW